MRALRAGTPPYAAHLDYCFMESLDTVEIRTLGTEATTYWDCPCALPNLPGSNDRVVVHHLPTPGWQYYGGVCA